MTGENLIEGLTDLAPIGRGGFATVYRAYDPRLDRVLAAKVFTTDADPHRFSREIMALGRLGDHPNIAEIIGHGTTVDGRPYFTMPLYSNGSLSSLVDASGPLSVESVLRTGVKMCGALATAHEESIVHGDVKPQNILITRYDDVVLADFGIARFGWGTASHSDSFALTLGYAPPEILRGERSHPSADIYSLGLTLYFALVGEDPVSGEYPAEIMYRVIDGVTLTYSQDRHPGRDVEDALNLCTARDPSVRPSPAELGERLRDAQKVRGLRATGFVGPVDPLPPTAAAPAFEPPQPSAEPRWSAASPRSDAPTGYDTAHVEPPYPELPWPPRPGDPVPQHAPVTTEGAWGEPLTPPEVGLPSPAAAPPHPWTATSSDEPSAGPSACAAPDAADRWWEVAPEEDWQARAIETFAPDRPTADDQLGYEPLVTGIVQLLAEQSTSLPLTIGVAGQWGAGKTSLMMQVRDRLAGGSASWTPVWFDAWKYQGRDSIWAGLARAIYAQAQARRRSAWGRALFRLDLERRRRGALASSIAVFVVVACAVFIVIQSVRSADGRLGWPGLGSVGAAVATIGSIAAFFGLVSAPFERAVARGSATRQYDAQLGISDAAERDIEHLLAAATTRGRRVAVFLDDVDRCSSATILETLTTITEIFGRRADQPVAFVLGVDMEMVVSAVHEQMADLRASLHQINERRAEDLGSSYLEKIFQLTVHLDGFSRVPVERLIAGTGRSDRPEEKVRSFVEHLSRIDVANPGEITDARRRAGLGTMVVRPDDLGPLRAAVRRRRADLLNPHSSRHVLQAEAMVMRGVRMTPRAAKRFDNAFRLQLQVANGTEGCELDFDPDSLLAVAKWVALRMFFPRLTSQLDGELGLLSEVEGLARDPAGQVAYRNRVESLGLSASLGVDLRRLLSVGPPPSSVALLPLDTFATIV